jgi:hypothetical protein
MNLAKKTGANFVKIIGINIKNGLMQNSKILNKNGKRTAAEKMHGHIYRRTTAQLCQPQSRPA